MGTVKDAQTFMGECRFIDGIKEIGHRKGGSAGGAEIAAHTNVSKTWERVRLPRHVRFTLSAFTVAVAAADDYGGSQFCVLPDSNLVLLGVESDLELVKGEVSNGLEAATDVNIALGTAIASNATLSGAMIDVLSATALTATDASPAYKAHSGADGTLTYPISLADSPVGALFVNVASAITADDVLTIAGTIDLFFLDLGNVTS